MRIKQLPDYEHDQEGNFGTSTILVDGVAHVVIDYCNPYAAIRYKILKDGEQVEAEQAEQIYKAYNEATDSFISDVINAPELEYIED